MSMDTERPWARVRHDLLALAVVAAASLVGACTASPGATPTTATSPSADAPATIPQTSVLGDLPLAPEGERIDTSMPTFSDPTTITNPLFSVSQQESVPILGHVDGEPFRIEVTLLPETRIIGWQGQQIEVAVSQYNAFLDGRITEVAFDLYAQADDGSVWYFGEDVFDSGTARSSSPRGRGSPARMGRPR